MLRDFLLLLLLLLCADAVRFPLLALIPRVHTAIYLFIYVCDNSLFCYAINWHIDPNAKSMVMLLLVVGVLLLSHVRYMCKCQIIIMIATAAKQYDAIVYNILTKCLNMDWVVVIVYIYYLNRRACSRTQID